eukprot:TRINITY_DN19858_c0_g1_i1.p1 TRINITY_DN19858_c0_g1~~TRINITY_DN19858_c0_g1_i1.p1  ORF type:complete len:428 (+),score=83.14 TRINITY_DN19858_c0_g1_i1:54-1286(+)
MLAATIDRASRQVRRLALDAMVRRLPMPSRCRYTPVWQAAGLTRGRRCFSGRRRIDGFLHYFGKLKTQEGMLRDDLRVGGYVAGMEGAANRLKGATVMDIGTGSGILAMTAAKLGAKKVYAVEASPAMARVASRLVRANDLATVVEVIPKHLEEITEEDVPAGSVDVIVSELFSHMLVGEVGLQVVTQAKSRFLKPGGLVLPERARLKLSPFEDKELTAELLQRHSFWSQQNFCGFDLSSALPMAWEQALYENIVDIVDPRSLLVAPDAAPAHELDLAGPTDPEHWRMIAFEVEFSPLKKEAIIDGFCGWWDVVFSGGDAEPAPALSTSPDAPPTVWAQCRFLLKEPLVVSAAAKLTAKVEMKLNKGKESYSLKMAVKNHETGKSSAAGPIELSDVYARHFAKRSAPSTN